MSDTTHLPIDDSRPESERTRTAPPGPPAPHLFPSAGRYAFGDEIAHGGMGVVYRATDTALGREVAVKVLQPDLTGHPEALRRFRDEGRITAQLQHPGIPPVHDLGTLPDGTPFLAMKLIKGHTLAELLKDRPDPAHDRGKFVAVFEQVCQAVAYAHSKGAIHRDLKPHNVMVGDFGEVQVMDWGLAKVMRKAGGPPEEPTELVEGPAAARSAFRLPDASGTRVGSILGSPAFMPPEQAIGAVDKIDARSDVFGLGAILCVVLTGHPPFVGTDAEDTRQLSARAGLGPARGRLDGCGADPDLIALCKQCLSADPADRPADADAVASAVAGMRTAAEERARRAEVDRVRADAELAKAELRAAEQRKRWRVQRLLGLAVAVLVLAGGAAALWQDEQAKARRWADLRRQFDDERRAADETARAARNADAVAELLGQGEAALKADDLALARLAVAAADRRAAEGGADGLAGRLDRRRADIALLARLNDLDERIWTASRNGGRWATDEDLTREWAGAFAAWGLVPGTTPPAEAARRLSAAPVHEPALAALERWFVTARSADLLALLKAADPDDFRAAVRDAIAAGQAAGQRLTDLLNSKDMYAQPPRFTFVVMGLVWVPHRKEILDISLRQSPNSFRLLMDRGNAELWGDPALFPMREGCYRAAVAVRPDSPAAHLFLGLVLEHRGDFAGAVAEYRRSIDLDRDYPPTHNNLGSALGKLGKLGEAIAAYREAIRLEPRDPTFHYNLGITLAQRQEYDAAEAELREAVRLNPKYAPAHLNLGRLRQARGNPDGALDHYRRAVEADPNHAVARATLTKAEQLKAERDGRVAPPPREVVR